MSAATQDAASRLLAQLRNGRRRTVEVEPGKRLVYLRPSEEQILLLAAHRISSVALARGQIIGWEGVTEAALLGAAIGSADPAPFTSEIAAEVLSDRATTWLTALVDDMVREVQSFMSAREDQRKNSSPSSTPNTASGTATSPSETSTTSSPSEPGIF